MSTTYVHAKNISITIKSDDQGKAYFTTFAHNEMTSSKNLLDVLIKEITKVAEDARKKFTEKKEEDKEIPPCKMPEQVILDFLNKNIKQQLMTTSIQATCNNSIPTLHLGYKLKINDLDIDLDINMDTGITIPVKGTVGASVSTAFSLTGVENNGDIQIVLVAEEKRLEIDDPLTVKFQKEGEISLDDKDIQQLDDW